MLYGKLLKYDTKIGIYKGESYLRAELTFSIIWFKKTIIQDLTMFEDWKLYKQHWNSLIQNKNKIPYSEIKNKKIFYNEFTI